MASKFRKGFPTLVGLFVASSVHANLPDLELSPRVIGEEVSRPSYPNSEAIAFNVGEASLYPAVSVRLGSNDNLFAEVDESDATSSTQLNLSPRLDYIASGAKQTFWIGYLGDYSQYEDAPQADYQDHRLSVISHTAFDSRRRLDLEASLTQSRQAIGTARTFNFTSAELDALTEVDTFRINKLGAAFSFGNPAVKGELVGGVGGGSIEFNSNEAETAQYDRDFSVVWSQLYYRLSPRMRVFGGLTHRTSDYDRPYNDDGRERDSTTMTLSAGIVRELSDLWFGRVDIRNRDRDFDNPQLRDTEGLLFNAELTWFWKAYSRFRLKWEEQEFESVLGNGGAEFSAIRLTWQHEWSDRLNTLVQLSSVERNETDTSLNSDYSQSKFELRFAPRRWLRVLGGYSDGKVASQAGDADRREVYLGVEANF